MSQLPDPIPAAEIADNPELLPASPILIEFSGGTLLYTFSGTASATNGEEVPCAQLEFRDPAGRIIELVLNIDDLEALGEVVDRLCDEVDPDESEPGEPEGSLGGGVFP